MKKTLLRKVYSRLLSYIRYFQDIHNYGIAFAKLYRDVQQVRGFSGKGRLFLLYKKVLELKNLEGDIIEIGSAWGRSTIVIAKAIRDSNQDVKLYAIDPHTGGIVHLQRLGVDKIDSYGEFLGNLAKFDVSQLVTPIRKKSKDAVGDVESEKIKLLWIDGWHTPEAIESDINTYFDKLVVGGYMILDDYADPKFVDMRCRIDEILPTLPVKKDFDIIEGALCTKRIK